MTTPDNGKPKRRKRSQAATTPDEFVSDIQTIQKCAGDKRERQAALTAALNRWANVDIARLERVDDGASCGWAMWKRSI